MQAAFKPQLPLLETAAYLIKSGMDINSAAVQSVLKDSGFNTKQLQEFIHKKRVDTDSE